MSEITGGRSVSFRSGAGLIRRLGGEQLRDEVTAIVELVKNAYDADSTVCLVEICPDERVLVRDDGAGMSYEDIRDKWCLLATENKLAHQRSSRFKRRRLGHKGIGRFACEMLGGWLRLRTRQDSRSKFLKVDFDWESLDPNRYLEEYGFLVHNSNLRKGDPAGSGTLLDIRRLRTKWTRARAKTLRRQLATLIDPDADVDKFRVVLHTPWDELNGELMNPISGRETHLLEFVLDSEGHEQIVINTEGQSFVDSPRNLDLDRLGFGPIRGKLSYFGEGLKRAERGRGGNPDEDWNLGIRISRDGWRIRPYGEPGTQGDWLGIYNLRYAGGSKFKLKPHYLMGSILITQQANPELRDTSSREGLSQNDAYGNLVEYMKAKIARLNSAVRAEEIKKERRLTKKRYEGALNTITEGLNSLRSDVYVEQVGLADKQAQTRVRQLKAISDSVIRNWHWECLDCGESWKVPLEKKPTYCREYSVRRDGTPTYRSGCGSTAIGRKENAPGGARVPQHERDRDTWSDFVNGKPAYVDGIQLRPVLDDDMGPRDEEAEVRHADRVLAFNTNHPSFRAADNLDGKKTSGSDVAEVLRETAALKTHLINAAAMAWGVWHFEKTADFEDYRGRVAFLKHSCLRALPAEIRIKAGIQDHESEPELVT